MQTVPDPLLMTRLDATQFLNCVLIRLIINDPMINAAQQNSVIVPINIHARNTGTAFEGRCGTH